MRCIIPVKAGRILTMIVLGAVAAGCATEPDRKRVAKIQAPTLIMDPLVRSDSRKEVARTLGRFLHQEMVDRQGGQVVNGREVPGLSGSMTPDNLTPNGVLNALEAAAMGRLAECNSVVITDLLDVVPFAPQRIALRVYVVDVASRMTVSRSLYVLDLNDAETRYRYANFVGSTLVGNAQRTSTRNKDRFHLAYLSPETFYRFAAHVAVMKWDDI
jgi:hypothetical protein